MAGLTVQVEARVRGLWRLRLVAAVPESLYREWMATWAVSRLRVEMRLDGGGWQRTTIRPSYLPVRPNGW